MTLDYKKFVGPEWRKRLNWDRLPEDIQAVIGEYGIEMFGSGRYRVANIDEIKYDGRLIVLDDGTRWEVDSTDASTCEYWSEFSMVVIIDDEMYQIEDAEKVSVQEEI